jgi:DNA-binding CsgD family transcriptional regulator
MEPLSGFRHAIERAESAEAVKLHVLDRVAETLDCDQTGLYFFEPGSVRPTEIHVRHLPEAFVLRYEQLGRDEDKVLARVMKTGEATYDWQAFTEEGWKRSLLYRSFATRYRIRHYLCAPIKIGGRVAGTLNLGRSSDAARFDGRARARAQAAARIIGSRLTALSEADEAHGERLSLKKAGQLRAERAFVRGRLSQIERHAALLSPEQAAAYYRALARDELRPIDCFDVGDRRYVLLRPKEATTVGASRFRGFTEREIEILERVIGGASNKAIGYDMGLAPSTVATHVSSAMAKLRVRSRVELIEELRRASLV